MLAAEHWEGVLGEELPKRHSQEDEEEHSCLLSVTPERGSPAASSATQEGRLTERLNLGFAPRQRLPRKNKTALVRRYQGCLPGELRIINQELASDGGVGVPGPSDSPHEEDGHSRVHLLTQIHLSHGDWGIT